MNGTAPQVAQRFYEPQATLQVILQAVTSYQPAKWKTHLSNRLLPTTTADQQTQADINAQCTNISIATRKDLVDVLATAVTLIDQRIEDATNQKDKSLLVSAVNNALVAEDFMPKTLFTDNIADTWQALRQEMINGIDGLQAAIDAKQPVAALS